ncbi:MAG: NADH-quinone oxidoreductase subunit C [Hyphomonadaceae bacterium]|nr:NADH-quinone oxidoreductase subunit C [Hyphomonadaceae bacterium]
MTDVVKPLTPAEELAMHVSGAMPGAVDNTVIAFDEVTLEAKADQIIPLLIFLRDDPRCQFQTLIDICGVDYPERVQRFDVVYHLLSMRKNKRIRIKIRTDETTPVSSAIPVYPAADWFERETFDMYGVLFNGHPDLRRLLTDYGFQGFPLRKDFPLTGHVEVRYDPEQQRVVYEPVKLPQAYRNFDFLSPWEGLNEILPGDEKAKG